MLTPLFFVMSISGAYAIPYVLDAPAYVSWGAVGVVYLVDMDISRQLYPDEMNTPEITSSEQMSYAGLASVTAMGLMSFLPVNIPQPFDFIAYMLIGSIAYTAWSMVL